MAGAGLGAWGDVVKAQGVEAGDDFKAAGLENAAQRGKVAAVETSADWSRKISMDLGNIDTIRAAAHTDPTSPTGAAVRDYRESVGLSQKSIAVDNILAQSRQEDAEAAYLRQAGKSALLSGYIGAGAGLLGAVGQGLGATPGGAGTPNVGAQLATALAG
jgi:hypothetical protein